jgi:hypothetical protein
MFLTYPTVGGTEVYNLMALNLDQIYDLILFYSKLIVT